MQQLEDKLGIFLGCSLDFSPPTSLNKIPIHVKTLTQNYLKINISIFNGFHKFCSPFTFILVEERDIRNLIIQWAFHHIQEIDAEVNDQT